MFTKTSTIKNLTLKSAALAMVFMLFSPHALAARYYLTDNNNLVKGCSGTIEIKVDTEQSNVMAGDTTFSIKPSEVTVNQLSIGSPLPMQVFSQFTDTSVKLSGARLPMSGTFNGVGTFGYINFTPNENANSGTFSFSSDLQVDNNLVDESINNVLTEAVSKTYTFNERYNKNIDGVGFCDPDTTPPTVQFIMPPSGSGNNPVNTNVVFVLTDNRAGVNINSLDFSVNGVSYNANSSQVTVQEDVGLYRVETNPDVDFDQGENVQVRVNICDLNAPANCTVSTGSFRIFAPPPPDPVCGDGFVTYSVGEQCDDGNTRPGDGCSSLCLWEVPVLAEPSCEDGLQNGGEAGIDCGGPCSKTCATCVDGLQNQNEESVDCGGPCPPCGEVVAVACPAVIEDEAARKRITICHYPPEDPDNPYSLVIRESEWADYESWGDTMGSCPIFDICSEALFSAAPAFEESAVVQAEELIEAQGVVETQEVIVEVVLDQLDLCKTNPEFAEANFDDVSADTDGDGLSDRMECYAEISPVNVDTDGDGCSDFEELNQRFTNPNDDTDCMVEEAEEKFLEVLITDPQPGWILANDQPTISGKVPASTALVLVIATQAEQNSVNNLIKSIDALLAFSADSAATDVQSALDDLDVRVGKANDFLEKSGEDFNSEPYTNAVNLIPSNLTTASAVGDVAKGALEEAKTALLALKVKPAVATASTRLGETTVGEFEARNFEEKSNPLNDRQIYDLVATAYLNDGSQVSSKAVRFSIDKANTIHKPIPKTIGGILIPESAMAEEGGATAESEDDTTAEHDGLIEVAFAQDGESGPTEVIIDEERPVITGETEFGSQVFAIWNSVVLNSSVISDSEVGAFEVQAPRNLEVGIPHRVTLYAVKTEGNNKIRSESIDVHFQIKAPGVGLVPVATASGGVLTLLIISFFIRRALQMRSALKVLKM